MKRFRWIVWLLPLALLAAAATAPARAGVNINVQINVKVSPVVVGFPLPGPAVVVERHKKHFDASWVEYRAAYPIPVMMTFYRFNMPKKGWVFVAARDPNHMAWVNGRRRVDMLFWYSPGGYTVIAVREGRPWYPPGQAKKAGKPGKGKH